MSTLTLGRAKHADGTSRPRHNVDYVRVGLWIALAVTMVIWAMPLIFVMFTSLKSESAIFSTSSFALPTAAEWQNYAEALETGNLLTAGGNSLLIAAIKVPLGLLFSAAAAFGLSRIRFKHSKLRTR